jgi:hypothetical protein
VKKIAQNIAQPIFVKIHKDIASTVEKVAKFLGNFCNFQKKTDQSKLSPNRRKIAQSDHPANQSLELKRVKIEIVYVFISIMYCMLNHGFHNMQSNNTIIP